MKLNGLSVCYGSDKMEKKLIGKGSFGECYLRKDGKVLKIYYDNTANSIMSKDFIVGVINDTYIFPEEMVYFKNTPIGTVMKYIDSLPLDKKDVSINNIINSIPKAYSDTDLLSKQGIELWDVFSYNVLYDDGIKIIDTDFFNIKKESNKLHYENIVTFNSCFGVFLFGIYGYEKIFKLPYFNKSLEELYKQTFLYTQNDNKTLVDFLKVLRENIINIEQKEINTMHEMKSNIIKRIK